MTPDVFLVPLLALAAGLASLFLDTGKNSRNKLVAAFLGLVLVGSFAAESRAKLGERRDADTTRQSFDDQKKSAKESHDQMMSTDTVTTRRHGTRQNSS